MFTTYTDNFAKENFIFLSFWGCWAIMTALIGVFMAFDCYKNKLFPTIAVITILIASCMLALVGIINVIRVLRSPNLKVDTNNFSFTYAEKSYDFDSLLPSYSLKKDFSSLYYIFTLYFKDGTSIELNLPLQVGLAFAEKYLNKYSKTEASLYL